MKIYYSSMWKCIWFTLGRWLVRFQLKLEYFGFRHWKSDAGVFWKIGNILVSRDKEDEE